MSRFSDGPSPGSPADDGPEADPVEVARTICLTQLTAGPRSRAQLAAVLHRKGVPAEAAEAVLDRLTEVGLIDDAAFARAWVESRQRGRGLSRRALAHELRARGVAPVESDSALATIDEQSEAETARTLVQRKIRGTRGLDPAIRVRRLAGMLARKGYPPGISMRVVRDALASEATGVPELDELDPDLGYESSDPLPGTTG